MPDAGFALLFLLFAIGGPLVLYALVQAEQGQSRTMSRDDAERVARRDTDDDR